MDIVQEHPFYERYIEVCNHLIAEHGEPKTEIINGRKFKVINSYLNSFNNFAETLFNAFNKFNINILNWADEIDLIMEYCKNAEYINLKQMAKLLENCHQKTFIEIFLNLNHIKTNNAAVNKVYICFRTKMNLPLYRNLIQG